MFGYMSFNINNYAPDTTYIYSILSTLYNKESHIDTTDVICYYKYKFIYKVSNIVRK